MHASHSGTGAEGAPSRDAERAAFIARVTAGATHELRNFFAIVKESAGLVGDLVDVAGPDRAAPPDKVGWALDRIRLQVRRGTELTDALNRVMHGLDHPTESVELGVAVDHAVVLARRFARRSQCRLQAGDGPELTVTVNALDLYRTLLGVMEWCFDRLPEEGAVTVRPEPADGRPAVRFALEPASPLAELGEDAVGELEAIAAVLTATATTAPDSVLLTFP